MSGTSAPTWVALVLGLITLAGIIFQAVQARRGSRDVAEVTADEGAYKRASEIDAGVHERVVAERDYFRDALDAEREGRREDAERHRSEKAELKAEVAELERRLRAEVEAGVERQQRLSELLDEVARLRTRHDDEDAHAT